MAFSLALRDVFVRVNTGVSVGLGVGITCDVGNEVDVGTEVYNFLGVDSGCMFDGRLRVVLGIRLDDISMSGDIGIGLDVSTWTMIGMLTDNGVMSVMVDVIRIVGEVDPWLDSSYVLNSSIGLSGDIVCNAGSTGVGSPGRFGCPPCRLSLPTSFIKASYMLLGIA